MGVSEKTATEVKERLFNMEFSCVFLLNVETEKFEVVRDFKDDIPGLDGKEIFYNDHIEFLIENCCVEEDAEEARKTFRLDNIKEMLERQEKFICTFSLVHGGRLRRYRWDYFYKDDMKKEIIILRIDITEFYLRSYRMQTELSEQLMKEKAAGAAKSEFLSTMSHDIRTPLNAILNMLQLTRDDYIGVGDGDVLDDLDRIDIASTFLLGLLNDVLDMSTIENGQMELLPDVYEFHEFVSYIDCIFDALCHEKNISFTCDYGKTEYAIYTDRVRFNQIFFNILSNAVKYTEEGGSISFRVYDNKVENNHLSWAMEVCDTGCGMSEEFQKKMFEPFERENKTEYAYEGTGLGLPIVKKIVDLMKGTLEIDSKVGIGTTVTIKLTMKIANEKQIEDYRERMGVKLSGVPLAGKHVLIVEDNEMNMLVLKRMLLREQMVVEEAWNGSEAIERFRASSVDSIDIILMDIRMPVMNGYDATREIRKLDRADAQTIPIIALTADGFLEDRKLSRAAGMNDHMCKPVNTKQLCSMMQKHIKNRES